jgi:tRNA threonylcarbamoyladenosine biosynthesis protein TsaB
MSESSSPKSAGTRRVLGIETSTRQATLALAVEGQVVAETQLPEAQRTAQSLAPALDAILREATWSPESIDLVSVTRGPGSFTGLRIAVTTAKTFAYAVNAQLLSLNTLDVIVEQLPSDVTQAAVVMDAQRQQLFAAKYRRQPDQTWQATTPCRIVVGDEWFSELPVGWTVTGPALRRWSPKVPSEVCMADESLWQPRAVTVAQLGWSAFQKGQREDLWRLVPKYYRPSYAEESASSRDA